MAQPDRDETLALAAVFQALGEVRAIAEHGRRDPRRIRPCLDGLLGEYTDTVAALYGGPDGLDAGLRALIDHLSQPQTLQLTRYLVAVMQLERRLAKDSQRLQALISGLNRAREQAQYFGAIDHASVIDNLADLYGQQISPHRPRIVVHGHAQYLQDEGNAAMIRSLLLAAIRAAGLWRASGGGRIRLVLQRRAVVESARALVAET